MSRLTRREMKRDELLTTITALRLGAEQHGRSIGIAVIAVIVLAGAIAGGVLYSRSRQQAAGAALAHVLGAASALVVAGDSIATVPGASTYLSEEEKHRDVVRLADGVLDDYPSTRAADWALYWKALSLQRLGEHDRALETLAPLTTSPKGSPLYPPAMLLRARVLESRGDLPGAVTACADLANAAPADFPVEIALLDQARLLERQGLSEEARSTWRRIQQEFPESPYVSEAASKLGDEPPAGRRR